MTDRDRHQFDLCMALPVVASRSAPEAIVKYLGLVHDGTMILP